MTKCTDCNESDIPQFVGQVAFKGNFKEPKCEECDKRLL
jgi:hypothetical protein